MAAPGSMTQRSPQPTWSSGYQTRLQTVQSILSKFIYNDTLNNRPSALTTNVVDPQQSDKELKDSQPWDRAALLHRLKTFRCWSCQYLFGMQGFRRYTARTACNGTCQRNLTLCRPGTWFGKPSRLSATVCASHGWTNSAMDTLTCPTCGAVICFTASDTLMGKDADEAVEGFLHDLSHKHTSYCIWHGHPPTKHELLAFPAASPQPICDAMVERVADIAQLSALPFLGGAGLAMLTDTCLPQMLALLDSSTIPISVRFSPTDPG